MPRTQRNKISPQKKPRRRYTQAVKRDMVVKMQSASTRDLEAATGIPKSNLSRWKNQTAELLQFNGPQRRYNLDGAGRPTEIPNTTALETYMHILRDAEWAVTCTHLVNFLKRHERPWLDEYLANKNCGCQALLKLLQRFCAKHDFTRQKPSKAKKSQQELSATRAAFAQVFNKAFIGYTSDAIFNVDETGMTYDMPPNAIWAVKGGSAKISSGDKNSYRMTAVLAVRANGEKLPSPFILRGIPGGPIEQDEFDSYPIGHYYAVQKRAWMDSRVWAIYLRKVLRPQVREPSALLLDNFKPHVSKERRKIASEEVGCVVADIPPNATSVVQPLDVGIMAPFKRHLRNLWLEEDLIEGSDSEEDVDMMTVPAQKKRLVMIDRAIKAWARITPQEIRRSFAKAIPQ
ncbi:hypothetical protein DYB26_011133 [Aphanomyces astaci]|uniref:DDE-1 domain-containing protein n=1 Tax=Aphanomyces astaci TaxID=112090 RepID=A0A418E4Q9_APHAT|nr:hypothetical protein DYB26_011133 [Aphanomyces astaci]